MYGGAGNDTLWISKGANAYLEGGLGIDSIYFKGDSFDNSTIYGGNLTDATSLMVLTPSLSVEPSVPLQFRAMVV